jgi:hypothetical protein
MRDRHTRGPRDSWLGRLERRLLTVLGPAQVGRVGTQPQRSADRTAGVEGRWELRRDSTGRTYLVAAEDGDGDPDEPDEPDEPDDPDEGGAGSR